MNEVSGHGANVRSTVARIALIGAVALTWVLTGGPGRGAGIAAVIVVMVAAQLLRSARWSGESPWQPQPSRASWIVLLPTR